MIDEPPTAGDDEDDYDPRDHVVDILRGLLAAVDPETDEQAWGEGFELLQTYDEGAAISELGYLYARTSDELVATIAGRLGVDLADVTDPFACPGCGDNVVRIGECYMVTSDVWAAAGDLVGWWCIGCIESRLGRQLVPGDFEDIPLTTSDDFDRSERLRSRIGAGPWVQPRDD